MPKMYIAYCGPFEIADPDPLRAQQRAISEMWMECGGTIMRGSWAWEQIEDCKARPPREAIGDEAAVIDQRNGNAWATGVINRD